MATPEEVLTFHPLYGSPLVSVRDYNCRACRGGPTPEEHSIANQIVLMRHGAFCKHFGRRRVTADVNQAVFFSKGSTYRVSHPADRGDRGTILSPAPRVLHEIMRELDPSVDERPESPFRFTTGPCESDVFWRHRELVRRLERADAEPVEPLWVDVTALQLIADVLEAATTRHGSSKPRRAGTDSDHGERVEAVKSYLVRRIGERVTLDDLARSVSVSPYHLARVFHERTGMPVHRYQTRLRLRISLERLVDGTEDLTKLALDLGFSSHSHFTSSFRREFGCAPSDARRKSLRSLREMSKILKV